MARKAHVIGYRLGEARWWDMRTPPQEQGERVEEDRGKQEIITGIMEKLGYLTGEMLIEGEAEKKERIKIIGSRHSGQKWKRSGLEVYMLSYIKEIIKTYYKKASELSYRQINNYYNDGKILAQSIAKSSRGLYPTMRSVKRMVLRETVRKNKIIRPRYKRYAKELVIMRRKQWALERAKRRSMREHMIMKKKG